MEGCALLRDGAWYVVRDVDPMSDQLFVNLRKWVDLLVLVIHVCLVVGATTQAADASANHNPYEEDDWNDNCDD